MLTCSTWITKSRTGPRDTFFFLKIFKIYLYIYIIIFTKIGGGGGGGSRFLSPSDGRLKLFQPLKLRPAFVVLKTRSRNVRKIIIK